MNKRTFLKALPLGLYSLFSTKATAYPMSQLQINSPMPERIAFIVFNNITLLDLIGVYDPITRLKSMNYLPDLHWDICAMEDQIEDNFGLTLAVDKVKPDLNQYDTIIIPGGFGTRPLKEDWDFIDWIKGAHEAQYKISVCTGALLLGAAGFLKDRRATTNASAVELLRPFCKDIRTEKVVEDGNVITAGAVSSSLNLGLYLCEKWAGKEARALIQEKMDFQC